MIEVLGPGVGITNILWFRSSQSLIQDKVDIDKDLQYDSCKWKATSVRSRVTIRGYDIENHLDDVKLLPREDTMNKTINRVPKLGPVRSSVERVG